MNLRPGCSWISSLMVTISVRVPRPSLGLFCFLVASSTGPDITFRSLPTMARRVATTPWSGKVPFLVEFARMKKGGGWNEGRPD